MVSKRTGLSRLCILAALVLLCGGCIFVFRTVDVKPIDAKAAPARVESPVKVHLLDGTVAVFPQGATFTAEAIEGAGTHYSLTLQGTPVSQIPLESVAALESFETRVRPAETIVASTLMTVTGAAASVGLLKALFGSCPTIYSSGEAGPLLEAEAFSTSIAPLFEARDVDRIGAAADGSGRVRLEVRNEALETHFLNHVELLEVEHGAQALAVPRVGGNEPLLLEGLVAPRTAVDRAGNDVADLLREADGRVFRTDPRTLEAAGVEDLTDSIELELPAPASDRAAVLLRARSSLLNTVLFYEFMLAAQGAGALDWLGRDLQRIGSAVELGDYFVRRMGLRISVWKDGAFQEVGRIPDVGPIAWEDLAVEIPVPPGDSLRVRLSFVADAWRIDRAAVAAGVRTGAARTIPLAAVLDGAKAPHAQALQQLAHPDEAYLVTGPGQRYWLDFQAGRGPASGTRTFFLAAQGHYTEWIRPEWLRPAAAATRFEATDLTLYAALQRWKVVKASYEQRFESSRIPVR